MPGEVRSCAAEGSEVGPSGWRWAVSHLHTAIVQCREDWVGTAEWGTLLLRQGAIGVPPRMLWCRRASRTMPTCRRMCGKPSARRWLSWPTCWSKAAGPTGTVASCPDASTPPGPSPTLPNSRPLLPATSPTPAKPLSISPGTPPRLAMASCSRARAPRAHVPAGQPDPNTLVSRCLPAVAHLPRGAPPGTGPCIAPIRMPTTVAAGRASSVRPGVPC